jgi:hypothetical protein
MNGRPHGAWVLVVFSAALVAGCGGGGGGSNDAGGGAGAGGSGGAGGGTFDSPSAFCRALLLSYANVQFECAGGIGTPPSSYNADCGQLDDDLAKNLITYDASKAATCLAAVDRIAGTGCVAGASCVADVIKGLVPDGQVCSHDFECGVLSVCERVDATSCVPRACVPTFARAGEACGGMTNLGCLGGFICMVPVTASGADGTCVLWQPGQQCADLNGCDGVSQYCGAGNTCRPRAAVGQSCAGDETCALLARCDAATRKCVAAGTEGQPCGGGLTFCWNGTCGNNGVTADPLCVPYHPDGAPCVESYECASGICGVNGFCVPCAI